MPLLVHPAVRAEHVPVIGGEDDDRVLVGARFPEGVEHASDLLVNRPLQLVVEAPLRLDPRLRHEDLSPGVDVALLTRGLGGQVFLERRRIGNVRHGVECRSAGPGRGR